LKNYIFLVLGIGKDFLLEDIKMRKALMDLGYTPAQMRSMSVERAWEAIRSGIRAQEPPRPGGLQPGLEYEPTRPGTPPPQPLPPLAEPAPAAAPALDIRAEIARLEAENAALRMAAGETAPTPSPLPEPVRTIVAKKAKSPQKMTVEPVRTPTPETPFPVGATFTDGLETYRIIERVDVPSEGGAVVPGYRAEIVGGGRAGEVVTMPHDWTLVEYGGGPV